MNPTKIKDKFMQCWMPMDSEDFQFDLQFVISLGKILGCFPFKISKDNSSFKATISPWLFIYSICVYLVSCYASIHGLQSLFLNYEESDFQDYIVKAMFVLHRVLLFILIPLSWCYGLSINKYFQEWQRFQSEYKLFIGKSLQLNLRPLCLKYTFVGVTWVIVTKSGQWILSEVSNPCLFVTNIYIVCVKVFLLVFFTLFCIACRLSFKALRETLLFQLQNSITLSPSIVKQYRFLYHKMFHIVSLTGCTFGGLMLLILLYLLTAHVMTFFAWILGVLVNANRLYVWFIVAMLISLPAVVIICCSAEIVLNEVSKLLVFKNIIKYLEHF